MRRGEEGHVRPGRADGDGDRTSGRRRDRRRPGHHSGRAQSSHHRSAPAGRASTVRGDRRRGRPVRSGGAAPGPASARRGHHADRRRHQPPPTRLHAPGHGRHLGRGRCTGGGRQAHSPARSRLRGHVRRFVRSAGRGGLRERRAPAPRAERFRALHPGRAPDRDVPVFETEQADLQLGHAVGRNTGRRPPMSGGKMSNSNPENSELSNQARRHLWMHFSRLATYETHEVPVIVRGEGAYVWDQHGKKYLDGLAGLFTSQLGHGRTELAEAGAKQAGTLAYFPLWTYAHPKAIELAERLAGYAPGDLNRVFFTSGGSEAVESAWKLVRQYFRITGQPQRTKVLSRDIAYHGTTMGALSITGIPDLKTPFEPLVGGAVKVPNTNFYRAPFFADDEVAFGQWAADEIERAILREGADTVAAVYLEPVQNAGGCFPPPPGYFQRVREICDRHGVLLVSDEVICAFGRLGHWFGALRYEYQPDIITVAKGLTSGYAPLGAMVASDRLMEPFLGPGASFLHGFTFAGHPVSCAVAMANLDVFEGEQILQHVQSNEQAFRGALEGLSDLPIVGNVRGAGYFYGIELVKDKETRESFDDEESERLLRGFLSGALFEAGLICRADDRGDPVVQLSPPLICGQEEFDFIASTLREVLSEAWRRL